MINYLVAFTPEAEAQIAELCRCIVGNASAEIAERYTDGLIEYCESLRTFPNRGTRRDDIRRGLRVTSYRRRTVIAFLFGNRSRGGFGDILWRSGL